MLNKAMFITNRDFNIPKKKNSWAHMTYNSRDFSMPDNGGVACFKKEIELERTVSKAVITATALGIFELYINGVRVGNNGTFDELKPGWTEYKKRVMSFTYDITDFLQEGKNSIIAEVSSGWYAGRISFGSYGFRTPAFCGTIEIDFADGGKQIIPTDLSWLTAVTGPYRTAEIWDGVLYDARQHREDADWKPVKACRDFKGEISPASGTPIRVREHLNRKPQKATVYDSIVKNGTDYGEIKVCRESTGDGCECGLLKKGENLILDMEQNMVGRPAMTVKAAAGTRIEFLFAELLNDSGEKDRGNDYAKGSAYIKNYRTALSRLVYIADGNGEEHFAPCHTFYGFRYLEIRADNDVEILGITGEVIGSDNTEIGSFCCSDEKVNKLYANIVWGLRGNYLSVPTDCPQRDERLGWTGDTQVFCGAGSYIADTEEFFRKWLRDARDTQTKKGGYGDVIPNVFDNDGSNAAWGEAGIIVPYMMYLKFNSVAILQEHFDSMEKYMRFLRKRKPEGPGTAFGDWLCYETTDKRYIADCYYAYALDLMRKIAEILGKTDRAAYYAKEHARFKKVFVSKYINQDGLTEKTQTAYLLALRFDLIPSFIRAAESEKLRRKIVNNNYILSTGFVGTGILNQTLAELGMDDLAYSLLLQEADPSWLYSVNQGATTVWERWNSYTIAKGFGDVGMNSFNHYAYGAVAEWMYASVAGIGADPKNPAFKNIILSPRPDMRTTLPEGQQKITFAKAEYNSRAGLIKAAWKADGDGFVYEFEIPEGSTADAEIFKCLDCIEINGKQADAELKNGKWYFNLVAGKYTIKA